MVNEGDTLLWQLEVASSLFDIVISALTDEEAMRPPIGTAAGHSRSHGDIALRER